MFFEATYVPSPQLSATSSIEDDDLHSPLPPSPPPEAQSQSSTSTDETLLESPVDHLIFVIHGIGQQTEQYGHFYEHIENLRETTRQVLQAKIPDHAVRIELIPIEWHRHIHDQVDPTMGKITLKSIPTIRLIENDYLADVLYYFSRERGQSIVDNVTNLFNTSYRNFLEKHKNFKGKIAVIGYSLGGIITYDILSHQRDLATPEEEAEARKVGLKFSKFDFKPDFFFGFGSPLGAVLTIRNQSPKLYHPDHDIIFENIFHPFDPLAYRFEPLLNEYYTDQAAVLVERSIPLGPSFSFPSMPSLPGTSLFSFFSWKSSSSQQQQQQQQSQEQGTNDANAERSSSNNEVDDNMKSQVGGNVARAAAQAGKQAERDMTKQSKGSNSDDSDSKLISSFNAFLQYFSSGKKRRSSISNDNNTQHSDQQEHQPGIITWDPIRDEARCHFLNVETNEENIVSTRITHEFDIMAAMQNTDNSNNKKRPLMRSRSRTVGSPKELIALSNSPDIKQDVVKSKQYDPENKMKRRHLVEVLGIDGIRMESLERAKETFRASSSSNKGHDAENFSRAGKDKTEAQSSDPVEIEQKQQGEQEEGSMRQEEDESLHSHKKANDNENDDGNSIGVSISKASRSEDNNNNDDHQASGDGKQNIWSDLNKEIHEPGPAITEPSESKIDVAKDASKGKDSETADDDKDKAAAAEAAQQQAKLPGGRRIDHVLQPESFMSMIANEYIVGLRAHFSYWTNKDLLWHVVCRLENLKDSTTETNDSTTQQQEQQQQLQLQQP